MQIEQQIRRVTELADALERRLKALSTQLTQMTTRLTTMATTVDRLASVTITSGQAPIPGITVIGSTRDIVVTLREPMPDTTYSVTPSIDASTTPNVLGTVEPNGIVAKTPETVTVRVKAIGVVVVGANIVVHAVRHS